MVGVDEGTATTLLLLCALVYVIAICCCVCIGPTAIFRCFCYMSERCYFTTGGDDPMWPEHDESCFLNAFGWTMGGPAMARTVLKVVEIVVE